MSYLWALSSDKLTKIHSITYQLTDILINLLIIWPTDYIEFMIIPNFQYWKIYNYLSSSPPNYLALPIILISLSLNHLTNLSDLTVPTSNLVGTFGIVRRLGMVGIVRKVGMVEMVSWSTNVATQVVDVQGKYQICVVNVYSTYEKKFTWIYLNLRFLRNTWPTDGWAHK